MKIRQGFVSNSSTSSFSVFAVKLDDIDKVMDRFLGKPEFLDKTEDDDERDTSDLDEYFNELGLDFVEWNQEDDYGRTEYYVGKKLGKFVDKDKSPIQKIDELRKILDILKNLFNDKEPDFYSGSTYNG